MKKITILLLLCAGLFISSCDKYLDVDPANVKAIGAIEDIKGMLGGYLYTIAGESGNSYRAWYEEDINFMLDGDVFRMFTYYDNSMDHTKSFENRNGEQYEEDIAKALNWSSIEVHEKIWRLGYKTIGLMNRVLGELETLNAEDSDLKQQVMGEAKVIRVWNAMKLLQYFAPFTNNELGIPLRFDAEDLVSAADPRRPQTEIFEMLISELKEVLDYTALPQKDYNVFYRKNIVNGILAQLYLYKATGPAKAEDDWANARTYAMAAMQGKYLATSTDELKTVFFLDATKIEYDSPYGGILFFWGSKIGGGSFTSWIWGTPFYRDLGYSPYYYTGRPLHPELIALYDENDLRMEELMFIYNTTYYENNKWLTEGNGKAGDARNTYQLLRTAELHLIVAETYAREGNDATAKQWLDEFKAARNTTYYASTDILTEIMNERKKEFFTEYDITWLDMKRNEMSLTHEFIDPIEGLQTVTLESNDYRFAFFIPVESELSVNPNLEQNPGWTN